MKFAELLQKYKDGSATDEEKRLVVEELEKNELINEYLSDKLLSELPTAESSDQQELKKIQSAVNRRLWKMVGICAAILLGAGALVYYVGLPAYNRQFYDPLAAVEGVPDIREGKTEANETYINSFSPLYLSASAFTELHCPGSTVFSAEAEPLGFGAYHVRISSVHAFDGQKDFTCKVVKGEQQQGINRQWFFKTPLAGVFYERGPDEVVFVDDNGAEHREQQADSRELYRDALPDLPKSAQISAYISFPQDVTLEELLKLEEEWADCSINWAAVRTSDSSYYRQMGFAMNNGGQILEPTEEFEAMFPAISLLGRNKYGETDAELLKEHFRSLLRYMSHQEDFLKALCAVNGHSAKDYKEALNYIDENGIGVYGVYVIGSKEGIMALEQRPEVNSFMIEDIKLSIFSS